MAKGNAKEKAAPHLVNAEEEVGSTPVNAKGEGARILIVDNESKYMADLKTTVEAHAEANANGKVKVDKVHVKDAIGKLKDEAPYDAVILSGSFKRRYDNEDVQNVIKFVDDYNKGKNAPDKKIPDQKIDLYGACLGHQALIHYHGKGQAEFVELGKYIKGDKDITLKDKSMVKSHKHHKHAFKSAPNLEIIATSSVEDSGGTSHDIVEAVEHKDMPYSSSQGHASRPGHAQDMLYKMLLKVYQKAA